MRARIEGLEDRSKIRSAQAFSLGFHLAQHEVQVDIRAVHALCALQHHQLQR